MTKGSSILVTGAGGMVGGAVLRLLRAEGYTQILAPFRRELDLADAPAVLAFFERHRPEYVLMIAARVGGIAANIADPVGFLEENLKITLNLFDAAHRFGVRKAVFLGSSCIYPRECAQPMREEDLFTGPLEPTNEGYALAKLTGLRLASYYERQHGLRTACPIPCNIYGTGDHFDLQRSHVLSALVRRFVDATDQGLDHVSLWGTGKARREFIHVDDVARAMLVFLDQVDSAEPINVGAGIDISIKELAELVARKVGFQGEIRWDASKPDGMLLKCMDVSKMKRLGFSPRIGLVEGIARTIEEYRNLTASGLKS